MDELIEYAVAEIRRNAGGSLPKCKICGNSTSLFDVVDFSKSCCPDNYPGGLCAIPVYYSMCDSCGFVFTTFFDGFSESQWRAFVYNQNYYTCIDPDYAEVRPRGNAKVIDGLLRGRKSAILGLDFGGGNGRTAELLRGMGYRYDSHDPFGRSTVSTDLAGRYNFCSALEVAEHTPNPIEFVSEIVNLAAKDKLAILIGTHTHDRNVSIQKRLAWWYAAPRNGHISLYSEKSLTVLARRFDLDCINFTEQTHLLTRGFGRSEAYAFLLKGKLRSRLGTMSAR